MVPALLRERLAVEALREPQHGAAQFLRAHAAGLEVDVEQRAALVGVGVEQPPLAREARVKGRARERRGHRHLHVEGQCVVHEVQQVVEDLRRVAVEAEDEAGVDADAVALDGADRVAVLVDAAPLPVLARSRPSSPARVGLSKPISTCAQPASRMRSSSSSSRCTDEVGLGEPVDAPARQLAAAARASSRG